MPYAFLPPDSHRKARAVPSIPEAPVSRCGSRRRERRRDEPRQNGGETHERRGTEELGGSGVLPG
jgi:hypothetical protein